MNPHEEMARGLQAQTLLENDLLHAALDAIESEVIEQWENCPSRDTEGKEALWMLYKTSKKFRGILTGHIETGKLAAEQLRRIDKKQGLLSRLRSA